MGPRGRAWGLLPLGALLRACEAFVPALPQHRRMATHAPGSSTATTSVVRNSTPFASDFHTPVLCSEVLEWLLIDPEGVYLDCTLGGGGHSEAILSSLKPGGRLVALDQDPDALAFASKRLERFIAEGRFRPLRSNFRDAAATLQANDAIPQDKFTGILLDLGVSSHQLDEATRGFSFRAEGPLDMRMTGREGTGLSADDLVNRWDPSDLRQVLKEYGEEPRAAKIAKAIASCRPLRTTAELREVVEKQVAYGDRAKTLARVFQGLRIVVNGEMAALEAVLSQATDLVKPGGRLVVLSYHSLEDRRVKRFMRAGDLGGEPAKDFYGNLLSTWKVLTPRSIRPSEAEVEENGRARSVSMRVAERTALSPQDVQQRSGAPPAASPSEAWERQQKQRKGGKKAGGRPPWKEGSA